MSPELAVLGVLAAALLAYGLGRGHLSRDDDVLPSEEEGHDGRVYEDGTFVVLEVALVEPFTEELIAVVSRHVDEPLQIERLASVPWGIPIDGILPRDDVETIDDVLDDALDDWTGLDADRDL